MFLRETRFLNSLLRPGDVLFVPGDPFQELRYLKPINVVGIVPAQASENCLYLPAPLFSEGRGLDAALPELAATGHRIFYSEGQPDAPVGMDVEGSWKEHQIFMPCLAAAAQKSFLADIRNDLKSARWTKILSPDGRVYQRLSFPAGTEKSVASGGRSPVLRYLASAAQYPDDTGIGRDEALRLANLQALLSSLDNKSARVLSRAAAPLIIDDLALTYQDRGRYRAALEILNWGVRHDPANAELYNDRGVIESLMGLNNMAAQDMDRAIKTDPDNIEAYLTLGAIDEGRGEKGKAMSVYQQALLRASKIPNVDPSLLLFLQRKIR